MLIIIAAIFAVLSFLLHRSANKAEQKFANRPSVIKNPAEDLFPNQKYAIVGLFATIQGASPITAFDDDINKMVQSTIFSLGLSRSDVEHYISVSLRLLKRRSSVSSSRTRSDWPVDWTRTANSITIWRISALDLLRLAH